MITSRYADPASRHHKWKVDSILTVGHYSEVAFLVRQSSKGACLGLQLTQVIVVMQNIVLVSKRTDTIVTQVADKISS